MTMAGFDLNDIRGPGALVTIRIELEFVSDVFSSPNPGCGPPN
jgi:hypothetical protein